jgi:hypothetical protein
MLYILTALSLVLHIAIAVVLVRKYLRTHDIGFVWLGVAVVIWPLVSRLLDHGERLLIDRLVKGQSVGYFPFSLVERGRMTIGGLFTSLDLLHQVVGVGLLLVAVLYLYENEKQQQSAGYPTASNRRRVIRRCCNTYPGLLGGRRLGNSHRWQ